ncbi:MAG: DUF5060 domain-containing protein, partial [Chloroflexi bacterium]|nr:DUF5060 domain-containing protein [Chloroflexota bacterium]
MAPTSSKKYGFISFITIACLLLLVLANVSTVAAISEIGSVGVYEVIEISFTGPTYGPADNPTLDVDFWADFQHESGSPTIRMHGFWDGDGNGSATGNAFKIRFAPTESGKWYLNDVSANVTELDNAREGDYVTAIASTQKGFWIADPNNNRWYMRSDGSHEYIVGNTHYDFLFRPNGQEATTASIVADLNANADNSINKVRFVLMSPRSENTNTSVRPFLNVSGNDTHSETNQPNPAFFSERVDIAVETCFQRDIICDLILGGTTGDQVAEETGYLKYVAARYGAYSSVWFTITQEWEEQSNAAEQIAIGTELQSYLSLPIPVSTHGLSGTWESVLNGNWHDHSIRQGRIHDMSDAANATIADYNANGNKPAVNDESGYDPSSESVADVVEGITGSFIGGGYGTTGNKTASKQGPYFWGHAAIGGNISDHQSIPSLGYLRDKVNEHIPFWEMTPVGPNDSIFTDANGGFRVLEWPGNAYVLGSDTLDSSVTAVLPTGTWTIIQLDITNPPETTLTTTASGSTNFATLNSRASLTIFKNNAINTTPTATPIPPTATNTPIPGTATPTPLPTATATAVPTVPPLASANILPLGDSITQGDTTYNSYRRPLWHMLNEAGYAVDFVGSLTANAGGSAPNPDFDLDHEGHAGWRADQVLNSLPGWLGGYTPDIVLLHVGHNDLNRVDRNGSVINVTLADIDGIIDALRDDNPNVTVLLAQLIPS